MEVIPPELLIQLHLDKPTRGYSHPNPFVRYIFWKRFEEIITEIPPCENILEVGYGQGLLLPSLSKIGKKVCGIDPNGNPFVESLLKAYDIKNVTLINSSILSSPFDDGSFNVVVSCDVMEHIKDIRAVLNEINRILVDNGLLLISVPTENSFYKIMRWLGGMALDGNIGFNKSEKPHDHYYNDIQILNHGKLFFRVIKSKYIISFLPLFHIITFQKEGLIIR